MEATYEYANQQAAEPFWQRIQKFFLLPLDRAVLLRIGGLSAALVVSLVLLLFGAFGTALLAAAAFAFLVVGARYGFKIIERSSKGYLIPSDYPLTDEDLVGPYLPYKYVAMNTVFGALAGLFITVLGGHEFLGILIWGFFFVVLMPAATMRLVMTGSLRGALNPTELVNLIQRIGKPYAALCAFVFFADLSRSWGIMFLAGAGGVGAGGAAGMGFLTAMLVFLLSAGFWYFSYVICALIGYAMYQYADRLEISVVGPGEERLMSSTGRHADVKSRTRDALIGQMVSAGEIKEAIDLLNDDLRERPNDLSLHARLHTLLLAENYTPKVEDHTEKYLALLVKSQNWREALDLVEEALARRKDWMPRQAEAIAPLARGALQKGRPQLAATLIRGFDKKNPNHPDIPQIYFVGAQLMAETAHQPDEARRILKYLLQRYGSDSVAAEAGRYLEVMNRIAEGVRDR
jgi:tetratricopeptide (TPR) repeat protein